MENNTTMKDVTQDFVLVKGDISGIQEFIFNVKSKGAAKSLKGRSFFMKVLTETAIQYLFDKFKVDLNERADYRISTSGGNFFLQLPKVKKHDEFIKNLQLSLSISLRFSGINLSLNYVELDTKKYSSCLAKLNQKVRESRLNLYSNLKDPDFYKLFKPVSRQGYRNIDENKNWSDITNSLRTCQYFSISNNGQLDLKINKDSIELIGYRGEFHNDPYRLPKIELKDYLESIYPLKYNSNKPKEFEDLANPHIRNSGASKLGILKMDVDNLGLALENIKSIKIHKEFDSQLNKFFNIELGQIINEDTFLNNIYTVTAGGDDSFYVGHWKIILELAGKINEQFSTNKYFKDNNLTISAGYVIVPPKFPVIRFSQLAEAALHDAKYKYKKGNISLFDEVISWEMLKTVQKFKSQLYKSVNDKSKGLLARARQIAIRGIEEDKISMKENWEIAYYLRDIKEKLIVKKIREYLIDSSKVELDGLEENQLRQNKQLKRSLRLILPIAARLTELEKR